MSAQTLVFCVTSQQDRADQTGIISQGRSANEVFGNRVIHSEIAVHLTNEFDVYAAQQVRRQHKPPAQNDSVQAGCQEQAAACLSQVISRDVPNRMVLWKFTRVPGPGVHGRGGGKTFQTIFMI